MLNNRRIYVEKFQLNSNYLEFYFEFEFVIFFTFFTVVIFLFAVCQVVDLI